MASSSIINAKSVVTLGNHDENDEKNEDDDNDNDGENGDDYNNDDESNGNDDGNDKVDDNDDDDSIAEETRVWRKNEKGFLVSDRRNEIIDGENRICVSILPYLLRNQKKTKQKNKSDLAA